MYVLHQSMININTTLHLGVHHCVIQLGYFTPGTSTDITALTSQKPNAPRVFKDQSVKSQLIMMKRLYYSEDSLTTARF